MIARRRLAWHAGIARSASADSPAGQKRTQPCRAAIGEWIEISVRVGVAIGWLEPMQGRGASGGPAAIEAVERRRIAEPADDRPHRAKQAPERRDGGSQNEKLRFDGYPSGR